MASTRSDTTAATLALRTQGDLELGPELGGLRSVLERAGRLDPDQRPEAAEFEIGLPDFGTVQFDFNYAPLTTVQASLETFQQSGDKCAIHYSLPKSGGERWVLGFIQQTGEQGQNGSLWTGSATFRATGKPVTVTP